MIGLAFIRYLDIMKHNPVAKDLRSSKYKQRVIKNKKKLKTDQINIKEAKDISNRYQILAGIKGKQVNTPEITVFLVCKSHEAQKTDGKPTIFEKNKK